MREIEKRILHEERRPNITTASDLFGPGIGPFSVFIQDWNAAETAFNGFFHSEPGAINTPDGEKYWMGTSQATVEGYGIQRVIEYRGEPPETLPTAEWIRRFYTVSGGQRQFTSWALTATGGGGEPSNYAWVTVVDPTTDVRPAIAHVMWVGGTTKPVNMGSGDLWVKAVA